MNAVLAYIAGLVVCSGLFIGFYRIALHQHASFRAARFFLFFALAAAAVIPALDIPVWKSAPIVITPMNVPVTAYETAAALPAAAVADAPDYWQYALWGVYGLGIAALVAAMGMQAVWIWRIRRRSEIFPVGEYEVAFFEDERPSFSFLSTVYVGRETPPDEMQQIILHETSHIRHRHSAEKIVMEILKAIMWFNPFAWLASRLLSEVHEFEADRDVLEGGFTVEEYLPVIFKQVFGYTPEISAGLANSLTKKRFKMMTKNFKRGKYSWLRTAGVLPIAAGMLMLFGFTKQAPQVIMAEAAAMDEPPKTEVTVTSETCTDGENCETTKIVIRKMVVDGEDVDKKGGMTVTVAKNGEPDDSIIIDSNTVTYTASNRMQTDGNGPVVVGTAAVRNKVVAYGHSDAGTIIDGLPADIFIWDNAQKREITKEELSARPVDQIKHVAVLKDGHYSDEIAQAIGDRKVEAVLVIGEIEGMTSATIGKISQIRIDNTAPATTGKVSQVRIVKADNTQNNVIVSSEPITTNSFPVNGEWTVGGKPIIIVKDNDVYSELPDNNLDNVNPNTIKAISVFKDGSEPHPAEVAKIIGDRKVNGVIVIELYPNKVTKGDPADVMPEYEGGYGAAKQYIISNIKYPKKLSKQNIYGRVMMKLVIKADGSIGDVVISESPHQLLSDEVVRVAKSMTGWTPGIKNGRPTDVSLIIPLDFKASE